jgi:hypothetical protein
MIVRTIKHGLAVARNALETYNAKLSSSMCDFTVVTKRSGFRAQAMEYGERVRIDRQSTICEPRRLRPFFGQSENAGEYHLHTVLMFDRWAILAGL